MEGLVILLLLGGAVAIVQLWRRTTRLEAELSRLHDRLIRLDRGIAAAPAPAGTTEPHPRPAPQPVDRSAAIGPLQPVPERAPRFTVPSLEELVGGRLLIWVGAAALVVAAFFLVRYSIESGLLGPAARALLAALFAALLIAASEGARRIPAVSGDPRIGQALAGAGVASAYGTLYLAAAVYDLIGALPAFALMLGITATGLALALRHGPPTALMALAGGFLAPLVAGFDAAGVTPLLIYLALFIAALFALASHRRWPWLAIAAAIAGFAWTSFLIVAVDRGDLAAVGAFVVLLAVAATLALPLAEGRWGWLRLVPLTLGLVQLLLLAPQLDFSPLAWGYYLVTAAAALVLAWRDARLLPAAIAALGVLLLLQAIALDQIDTRATQVAALIATLLFAIPGHRFARRDARWAVLAIGGTAGPLLVANLSAPRIADPAVWMVLALVGSGALAWLAHHLRDRFGSPEAAAAAGIAALSAILGIGQIMPRSLLAVPILLGMAALLLWARRQRSDPLARLALLPLLVAIVAALDGLIRIPGIVIDAMEGSTLTYTLLAQPGLTLAIVAPPAALAIGWLLRDPAAFGARRRAATVIAGLAGVAALYVALKLPLAIATPARFTSWGFAERALITHAFLGLGWWLHRRGALRSARALLALGIARIVWLDLGVVSPLHLAQAVGPVPVANLAVLHAGAATLWFASLNGAAMRRIAMVLSLVAALALVRQAAHGTFLTGPVTTGENWGYSAILLLLAILWLWRGINVGAADLRRGGLALLVLVTLKVSVIDAGQLDGILRIASFLGLGIALIGIHWLYNRFLKPLAASPPSP